MKPRSAVLRETADPPIMPATTAAAAAAPFSSHQSPSKPRPTRKLKAAGFSSKENAPPSSDLNSYPPPLAAGKPSPAAAKLRSPLPPRPPSSNPLKRKLAMEAVPENSAVGNSESGVQVVVRMRPPRKDKEEEDTIVQKISSDSLTINGHNFTFDSVADTEASQLDVFQLVGAPLVENCMAGFNSSVFAYGQTGSGKTYTMWGPANAMLDDSVSNDQKGLTPRVFEHLFARINEEQIKNADRQLKYQCHCSLLEIYNEQITDLLDPNQKNLQIREDVKSGIYVENLTEECVRTMADVKKLLMKGLSNRRTGATSINSESSRSHTVFTCVLESRCKSTDGLSSFKTSRINLVDLAGSERQKSTGAAGERLKEAGNINRSLSQLGNLINILAEVSQTGKQRHIPYRDSRLTFLLQESLGGNAKLAMLCAISPTESCKSETFSTLRFAQRAKAIKNKAIVNEVMEDDVNHLREVIRQLRDELHRIKSSGVKPVDSSGGHSAAWIRRSLHLLKSSLNRPMPLPNVDDDSDEEMEIDEEAVENLCNQVEKQSAARTDNVTVMNKAEGELNSTLVDSELRASNDCTAGGKCTKEKDSEDTDVRMEEGISEQYDPMIVEFDEETIKLDKSSSRLSTQGNRILRSTEDKLLNKEESKTVQVDDLCSCPQPETEIEEPCIEVIDRCYESPQKLIDSSSPSLRIDTADVPSVLKSPAPSLSPKTNSSRKSLRTSSMLTASQKDPFDSKLIQEVTRNSLAKSLKQFPSNSLATQTSKSVFAPTEHLAASIRQGLEIIDNHRKSSAFRMSAFRFSYRPTESKSLLPITKVDVGIQTTCGDKLEDSIEYMCSTCKNKIQQDAAKDGNENSNAEMQLVPVDGLETAEKPDGLESAEKPKQVPKAVQKVLAGAIRREMALEDFCAKQASEIVQLNRLVQQFKHERECNSIISQTREDKILRLESLLDGILPTEDFMEAEFVSLKHEHELLRENYENHPEVLKAKIELHRVQAELESVRNFCDMGEREVLMEEIQDLRNQLKYYVDSSSASRKRNPVPDTIHACDPNNAIAVDQLEQERSQWTEAETQWISLSEELRKELEASRSQAEKTLRELETEKKCADELREAMQRAMQGHARMLDQYADLEVKHMQLLARHRKVQEGIEDVKKAASKAGVRGAESKFINALASEISVLKIERERERRYLRDENKGLQAQLRDTAEAVQAAGELLIRLKEAEESVAIAQNQAIEAKREAGKAHKQIEKLKKKHEKEMSALKDRLAESLLPKEEPKPAFDEHTAKYDNVGDESSDQKWREEFEPFYNGEDGELPKLTNSSAWYTGYDRCNV